MSSRNRTKPGQTIRQKFLTGAPVSRELDWSNNILLKEFIPQFRRFLDQDGISERCAEGRVTSNSGSFESSLGWPKWRSIAFEDELSAGLNAQESGTNDVHGDEPNLENTSFLSVLSDRAIQDRVREEPNGRFLEHSFQLYTQSLDSLTMSSSSLSSSSSSSSSSAAAEETQNAPEMFLSNRMPTTATATTTSTVNLPNSISSIASLPSATYLKDIAPQTVTVNLLVGTISMTAPRQVQLRRSSGTMDIQELLVGDETKAGFSITFWLRNESNTDGKDRLRQTLGQVRARDLLVLRNVALNVYRGRVYGQSLNARICKNETKVEILGKDGYIDLRLQGSERTMDKATKVMDWICDYVGIRERTSIGDNRRRISENLEGLLPPDSLEVV